MTGGGGRAGLVITGAGVVSAAGLGLVPMADALVAGAALRPDVTGLYPDLVPYQEAPVLTGFDVRAILGRKGTSFLDRATSLAMVACGQAIEASGMVLDDSSRKRCGIALGTTVGSFRSSSEYSRETLQADRPYLVNPVLFPNTVMNCASGQAAIRYRLEGVNSTIAGGRAGFLGALQYAVNALVCGYADAMLVGAVEEYTPHNAWAHHQLGLPGLPGEGAAVFMIERAVAVLAAGRGTVARIGAVLGGFHPGGDPGGLGRRLAACIQEALGRGWPDPGPIGLVAVTEPAGPYDERVAAEALPVALRAAGAERIKVREVLGECGAAGGALQLAAVLGRWRDDPGAGAALLASWTSEGAFGTAVVMPAGDAAPVAHAAKGRVDAGRRRG